MWVFNLSTRACTDLSEEGCRVRAQIIQHVSSLTLSVVGQQLQKLWGCLLPFHHFWSWNLNITQNIVKHCLLLQILRHSFQRCK